MRRRQAKFREQNENQLRVETITKLFSTVAMTVTAVVVVAVVVPQSPTAALEDVIVYEDRVAYRVNVVDPDQAIIGDALLVRLSNQLEQYDTMLSFGYTLGSFANLNASTSYYLEVLADKGFGYERLDSKRITTLPRDGGLIAEARLMESLDMYSLSYEVDVVYYNSQETYTGFVLEYASYYEDQETSMPGKKYAPADLAYTPIPVTTSPATILIENVPAYDQALVLRLLGYTGLTEYAILDAVEVPLPFRLEAYAYLEQVSVRLISAYVYKDYYVTNAVYTAQLLHGNTIVATKAVAFAASSSEPHSSSMGTVSFTGLAPLTEYTVRFIADYVNPRTLRQEQTTFTEETATTLGTYDYEFSYEDLGTSYTATITLIDPSHNFQQFYYEIYETGMEYPSSSGQNGFLSPMDKTSTIVIDKPSFASYRIVFGVRNQMDYVKYDVIHTIYYP